MPILAHLPLRPQRLGGHFKLLVIAFLGFGLLLFLWSLDFSYEVKNGGSPVARHPDQVLRGVLQYDLAGVSSRRRGFLLLSGSLLFLFFDGRHNKPCRFPPVLEQARTGLFLLSKLVEHRSKVFI